MTTDDKTMIEQIETALQQATFDGADRTEEYAAAVLPIIREAQADAWDEGHSWGWSDAQEAHDMRQVMPRSEWRLCAPNPYRTEQTDD